MSPDEVRAWAIGAIREWAATEDQCWCENCETRLTERATNLLDLLWDYGVDITEAGAP